MKPFLLLGLCLFSSANLAVAQSEIANPFAPFIATPVASRSQKMTLAQLSQQGRLAVLSLRQPIGTTNRPLAVAWGRDAVLLSVEGAWQLKTLAEMKALYSGEALVPLALQAALQIDNAVQVLPITSIGAQAEVVANYTLRNTGKVPLDVSVTSTSCGCTAAKLEKNRLEAGQSTKLTATMHADSERLVTVTLATNDAAHPRTVVALQSKQTFAPFQMPAPLSLFGEKGQSISATTDFELPVGWKIARVTSSPHWIQTQLQPQAAAKIAAAPNSSILPRFSLTATAPDSATEGTVQGQVQLELVGAPLQRLSIPIGGFVSNDISASPRMVVLGEIASGIARRTVVVRGPKPFSILAVRGDVPELKASVDPKVVAKAHAVELLIPVAVTVGDSFFRRATLELSDGRELSIDITGTVAAGRLPAVAQNLTLGAAAPAFEGKDASGKSVSLASFRGRQNVLLTFFPHCFTGGCESHLASLQNAAPAMAQTNTQIIAVSTDDASNTEKFARQLSLSFPVISDAKRQVSLAYGAAQNSVEAPSRMSVLIDKTGKVRFIDTDVKVQTHGADMLAKIGELGLALAR